jgi:toxin ParE1/3/4
MRKYTLTKKADRELEDILFYTKNQWGDNQFEKYTAEIYGMFEKLSENPNLGTPADYIFKGVRKLPLGKHLVFYIILEKQVVIVRILHSSQDIEKVDFNLHT